MDSPKSTSASGLQTVADVILAPAAAFERLRTAPTWGWAILITIVVSAITSYLITPAIIHGMQTAWPSMVAADPRMAQLTPEKQQQILGFTTGLMRFAWIFTIIGVPIAILVTTVVMLIFKAIGRGSASFASLWAAAANITVPAMALSGIVMAIIVLARGADSFATPQAITGAMPSLAWIIPATNVKTSTFFASLNIFQIWAAILIYIAMRVTARVGLVPAVLAAVIVPLCAAILAAAGAK